MTVHVAGPLRGAVDGRRKLELGLPRAADLGDVLQTLVSLYPRLRAHLPNELRNAGTLQLNLLFEPNGLESGPLKLREGQHLYLVADQPRRLADHSA